MELPKRQRSTNFFFFHKIWLKKYGYYLVTPVSKKNTKIEAEKIIILGGYYLVRTT